MNRVRYRALAVLSIILGVFATTAFGSGFALYEQGAKAVSLGGAFAATADDPSAIFFNVAGIAYQRQTAASVGSTVITFAAEFTGSNDEFPGPDTTAFWEDHIFTPVNAYFVMPLGENMTIGYGQFTPYGLRTDWEDAQTFPGRFISKDANLKTQSIQPSFAMKTPDGRFAWGAGIEYRLAHVTLARNIGAPNPFTQGISDIGKVRLDSDWNGALGWNVGLMFRPNDSWSIGASYRAAMEIDFDGTADFTQLLTGFPQFDAAAARLLPRDQDMSLTLDFPANAYLGVAHQLTPTWRIEADLGYATWSKLKELLVDFRDPTTPDLVAPQNWDDTYTYRLGANHQVTSRWDLRFGMYYDENPQPVESVGPLLPDSDRWGPSFGVGFKSKHWHVDVTELYVVFKDRDTKGRNQDNFNGVYKTTANLLSFNLGYTF